jgi:predicted  nucleic acid-binding Zn-ribbon protein
MAITRQLFELQEIDINIEQTEQTLAAKTGELGKRDELDAALARLETARQQLQELNKQRHDAEWQLDDVTNKITEAEKQLYGGKITNPKELSNLQHEVNLLKSRSDQMETGTLQIIDQVEDAEKVVADLESESQKLESAWKARQEQLTVEIEQLKASLANLTTRRQNLAGQIDAAALALYERIRAQKKQAVAKVEQGICRACRISLSASALQKARGGAPVQCGTCGRILYIS